MGWVKRHFDITLILLLIAFLLVWIILNIYTEVSSLSTNIIYLVLVITLFIGVGWQLRQKNRSLVWLLLLFVPFGIFVIFWLLFTGSEKRVSTDNRI